MVAECPTLIQGTTMRATLIDSCGAPLPGVCSTAVTTGFMSVSLAQNVENPDEFKRKTAGGTFCLNQRSKPQLNWIEATINLCQVSPVLLSMLTGLDQIMDDSTPAVAVGFGVDTDTYASASFALELWTNVGRPTDGSAACGATGTRYGYLLLPWLLEGTLGDIVIGNDAVDFSIKTITTSGNDWGVGPYDVIEDNASLPSPLLVAIPTNRHQHLQLTTLAPPEAACGCIELVAVS